MARVLAKLTQARAAVAVYTRKPRPELPVKARTRPTPPTPRKGKPTK